MIDPNKYTVRYDGEKLPPKTYCITVMEDYHLYNGYDTEKTSLPVMYFTFNKDVWIDRILELDRQNKKFTAFQMSAVAEITKEVKVSINAAY